MTIAESPIDTDEHIFTLEELLQAAEKSKYKNYNDSYIEYDHDQYADRGDKVTRACFIGEAFLNLGMVENGIDANTLDNALSFIEPDDGPLLLKNSPLPYKEEFKNLAQFINVLNYRTGYKTRKQMTKAVRKYFHNALGTVITLGVDEYHEPIILIDGEEQL